MPEPAYMTYGNVDLPAAVAAAPAARASGPRRAAGRRSAAGPSGSSAAACPRAYRTPYEIDEDAYAAKVAATGEVDVLCTTSRRPSRSCCTTPWRAASSAAARRCSTHIRRTQPRYALFGHVHQPLARRVRIGRTECINVGHFRATGIPYVLEWE